MDEHREVAVSARRGSAWRRLGGRVASAALLGLGVVASPAVVAGQEGQELSAEQIKAAVGQIADFVREIYLFEDMAEQMSDLVTEQHASGVYEGMNTEEFRRAITRDLADLSHDRHMYMNWDPEAYASAMAGEETQRAQGPQRPTPEIMELYRSRAEERNSGIVDVRWLPEQVGYLRISSWHPLPFSAEPLRAAMEVLQGARALIVDIRGNGGGAGDMVGGLQGYFMEPGLELLHFTNRFLGRSQLRAVDESVPGERLAEGIPVYVLADGGSGSASEDLAYTVKHAGRGTVVGENTAGAGHMNTLRPVAPGFMLSISWAGPVSPVTGGNWEGTGVVPDVEALSPVALETALIAAYDELGEEGEAEDKERMAWRSAQLRRDIAARMATDESLREFEGRYGPLTVSVHGTYLAVTPEGRGPRYYRRINGGEFEAEIGSAVVTFEDNGGTRRLVLEQPGRPTQAHDRR